MKRFLSLFVAMALTAIGVSSTTQADVLYSLSAVNLSTYDTAVAPPTPVSRADFPGAFCVDVALDSSLNAYVSDPNNGIITKTTPAGVTTIFATVGGKQPSCVAFSPAGDLYATMWGSREVLKFDALGNWTTFATPSDRAEGMAFAPDGTLYVGTETSGIIKYNAAGEATAFAGGLAYVYGLAFDASGVLWGTTFGDSSLRKFDMATGANTLVASGLDLPWGLDFDSSGQLYVASYGGNQILKVTAGGSVSSYADRVGATNVAFAPVPLPTTAAMGLLGAGLTLIRRRRAAKTA